MAGPRTPPRRHGLASRRKSLPGRGFSFRVHAGWRLSPRGAPSPWPAPRSALSSPSPVLHGSW
eukprot:5024062-Alexandrium_andersonii.AAC.1